MKNTNWPLRRAHQKDVLKTQHIGTWVETFLKLRRELRKKAWRFLACHTITWSLTNFFFFSGVSFLFSRRPSASCASQFRCARPVLLRWVICHRLLQWWALFQFCFRTRAQAPCGDLHTNNSILIYPLSPRLSRCLQDSYWPPIFTFIVLCSFDRA